MEGSQDVTRRVDQLITDLNNISVLAASYQNEITNLLCDFGSHFQVIRDLQISNCQLSQALLNYVLAGESRQSLGSVRGVEATLSKVEYDVLMKLYRLRQEMA